MGCNICKFSSNEYIIEEEENFKGRDNSQKENIIIPTKEKKLETKENLSSNLSYRKKNSNNEELLDNLRNNTNNDNNNNNNNINNSSNNISNNNNNINTNNKSNNNNDNNVETEKKKILKSVLKNKNKNEIEYNVEVSNILSSNKADYNTRVIDLINQIRSNPENYSEVILDNIQFISKEIRIKENDKTGQMEEKEEIFFQKKVKVKLNIGEKAFKRAAEYIKDLEPMDELVYKDEIKLMLPENEGQLNDNTFVKKQLTEIRKKYNINAFFKDSVKNPEVGVLLMIVGDSKNAENKKRNAILNPEYKYISVNSKFIGDSFLAYYSFSK